MLSFLNDYSEGALPQVMEALQRTNLETTVGYSCDEYCKQAADTVRARFACPNADVHFIVGGTIANTICISAFLRPWEAVIAASTAHICVHETGAIESSGHKICTIETADGKLRPEQVKKVVLSHRSSPDDVFGDEHMVFPRLVYISDATELGTIYTKAELQALHDVCRELGLYLFLDGARMAPALVSEGNDLVPEDFAKLCDAFYIGGTKDGLLFGEAVVIVNDALKPHFRNMIKQRGGMVAKGRLFGVQFSAFFENDLWLDAARHAVSCAQKVKKILLEKGYELYTDTTSNMVFPVVTDEKMAELKKTVLFDFISKPDDTHSVIRFVCSWASKESDIEELAKLL